MLVVGSPVNHLFKFTPSPTDHLCDPKIVTEQLWYFIVRTKISVPLCKNVPNELNEKSHTETDGNIYLFLLLFIQKPGPVETKQRALLMSLH